MNITDTIEASVQSCGPVVQRGRSVPCGDGKKCKPVLEYCYRSTQKCKPCATLCDDGSGLGWNNTDCANNCPDFQRASCTIGVTEERLSELVPEDFDCSPYVIATAVLGAVISIAVVIAVVVFVTKRKSSKKTRSDLEQRELKPLCDDEVSSLRAKNKDLEESLTAQVTQNAMLNDLLQEKMAEVETLKGDVEKLRTEQLKLQVSDVVQFRPLPETSAPEEEFKPDLKPEGPQLQDGQDDVPLIHSVDGNTGPPASNLTNTTGNTVDSQDLAAEDQDTSQLNPIEQ